MSSMMIVSVYFKHVRVFFPISFTILESDQTPFELVKALQKIKIEVLDQMPMQPTQILCSAEPQLITAVGKVFANKRQDDPFYPSPIVSHVSYARKILKLAKYF